MSLALHFAVLNRAVKDILDPRDFKECRCTRTNRECAKLWMESNASSKEHVTFVDACETLNFSPDWLRKNVKRLRHSRKSKGKDLIWVIEKSLPNLGPSESITDYEFWRLVREKVNATYPIDVFAMWRRKP